MNTTIGNITTHPIHMAGPQLRPSQPFIIIHLQLDPITPYKLLIETNRRLQKNEGFMLGAMHYDVQLKQWLNILARSQHNTVKRPIHQQSKKRLSITSPVDKDYSMNQNSKTTTTISTHHQTPTHACLIAEQIHSQRLVLTAFGTWYVMSNQQHVAELIQHINAHIAFNHTLAQEYALLLLFLNERLQQLTTNSDQPVSRNSMPSLPATCALSNHSLFAATDWPQPPIEHDDRRLLPNYPSHSAHLRPTPLT